VFLGHFAIAFAAKRAAPRTSLGVMVAAAQFADLLWPVLVLSGVEVVHIHPGDTAMTPLEFVHYPISHSLLALCGWGLVLAAAYGAVARAGVRPMLVVGLLVVSHWFRDVLVHRPDMPLGLGEGVKYGLAVRNSRPHTFAVELGSLAACVGLYGHATRARDRAGTWGFAAFVAFLVIVFLANMFGPPPPDVKAVAWTCVAMWLLVAWAAWFDRHREPA